MFSSRNDTQRYKNEVYKNSKIFTVDVSDHDLCCMCTNLDLVHKSKVDSHPCIFWKTFYFRFQRPNPAKFIAFSGHIKRAAHSLPSSILLKESQIKAIMGSSNTNVGKNNNANTMVNDSIVKKNENQKKVEENILPHQDHGYAWVIVFGNFIFLLCALFNSEHFICINIYMMYISQITVFNDLSILINFSKTIFELIFFRIFYGREVNLGKYMLQSCNKRGNHRKPQLRPWPANTSNNDVLEIPVC